MPAHTRLSTTEARAQRPARRLKAHQGEPPENEWISLRQAAAVLKIHPNSFYRVLAATAIRRLEYPGLAPLYSRADVQELADSAVKVGPPTPRPRSSREAS